MRARGEVSTVLDTGETTGRARMGVMRRLALEVERAVR